MATSVTIALPPASFRPARKKVTMAGRGGTVTFDIMRPEVDIDRLGDAWEEASRVGHRPILERVGEQLRTVTLSAVLTREKTQNPSGEPASVDRDIQILAAMATPLSADANTVVLAYDGLLTALNRTGAWVITDLRVRTLRRRPSDNAVVRAEVDISLTEASRPPRPATGGQATSSATTQARVGPPPAPPATTPPPQPAQRRHTVRSGETLWGIAQHYYGNGAYWTRIASANNVRDPRRLAVGTVLTIP